MFTVPLRTQLANPLTTPCHARACSIMQLDQLVRQPTEQRLINSASFLKSQLPARLENHIYRLKVRSAASSVPFAGHLLPA